MNRDIVASLIRLGPSTAEAISKHLSVSQPTVSRLVSANSGRVIRAGGSKNTIYGAARRIRQLQESEIPVFSIDEHGKGSLFGSLASIHPEGYLWLGSSGNWPLEEKSKLYFHSLPYFIHDARPQGFMGRNFARINTAVLGVPDNPERWTDDDVVVAMSIMGDDLAGNLIVGEISYRRYMEKQVEIIEEAAIGETYLAMAQRSVSTGIAGSSAAGEFPKFTAVRMRDDDAQHVIVKFSGSGNSLAERRWSDLLRCEAHAARIMSEHLRVDSAKSMAFSHGGRTFMESVRFDRVGLHGRISMCSLGALDAELVGMGDPAWDKFADKLLALRIIDAGSATAMRKAWYFGKLIGNSDMHAGNLSFRLVAPGKVRLCPVYDMLPMRYAPLRGGEVPEHNVGSLYAPLPGNEKDFAEANAAAMEFWKAISADDEISDAFRKIAGEWVARLKGRS
jgi:hypothetical protein